MTLSAFVLRIFGLYDESSFAPTSGYLYIMLVMNFSVAYAFYVLARFYTVLKYRLKDHNPIGKFLCIKFVIFFAFWQVRSDCACMLSISIIHHFVLQHTH